VSLRTFTGMNPLLAKESVMEALQTMKHGIGNQKMSLEQLE